MAHHITNSAVIYRGPSMLDGSPIMAIVTGLDSDPRNAKTGDMLQIWILRSDVAPLDAVRTGQDAAICGDCPSRGRVVDGRNVGRSCYVTVMHSPRNLFASEARGIYRDMSRDEAAAAFAGRKVRLGAYGDPAALPIALLDAVLCDVEAVTGYTHQWRRFPELATYCMASCDLPSDRAAAAMLGFRTFRVRLASDPLLSREVVCPASNEAGHKTICSACLACGGHSSKARADVAIVAHGSPAKHYRDWRASLAA